MLVSNEIPLPDEPTVSGRPPEYPFRTMQVGESFQVLTERLKSVRTAVWRQNNNTIGRKFVVRKHGNRWRCWRTA